MTAFLDDVAGGATRIGFNGKEGRHEDQTGAVIDDSVSFAVAPEETRIGYIKFNGAGEQPTKIEGRLYSGFIMPSRDSLGDTDQSEWEKGLSGQPADPWQQQIVLPLVRIDTGELYAFTTTSITGRRAVGTLLKQCDRIRRVDPQAYPIIQLRVGGFNHRDTRIGFVKTPVLAIVEWKRSTTAGELKEAPPEFSDLVGF